MNTWFVFSFVAKECYTINFYINCFESGISVCHLKKLISIKCYDVILLGQFVSKPGQFDSGQFVNLQPKSV